MAKDYCMKYGKKAGCPDLLTKVIDLVNILPDDAVEKFDKICDERRVRRNDAGIVIYDSAKGLLDEKLVEYCFDREPQNESVERFEDLMKAKDLLIHLAGLSRKFRDIPNEKQNDKATMLKLYCEFLRIDYKQRQFTINLGVSLPNGIIKPVRSEFLDLFEKSDISFHRIRSCWICQNIYWAKKAARKNETCGKKCADRLGNERRKGKLRLNQVSAPVSEGRNESRRQFLNQDFSKK